jgi:uracil-DNA glycosylase
MLTNPKHLVLKAPHPSPLSAYRGFFGCKHFSQANKFLSENGVEPIDWQIENLEN